ncbi:MAG: hypothetical protein IKN66_09535 [Ruminococcus sp.]|nr:hypothetical protein [Ruminococcus sp.]
MMNVDIKWDTQRQLEQLAEAQKYIDRQCIELMEKYTPFRTGALVQSVVRGTKIGSGHIVYNSPYARYQYYGVVYGPNIPFYVNGICEGYFSKRGVKKHPTNRQLQYKKSPHPFAQRLWFETMKKKHGEAILRGAAAIAGGKAGK